MRKGFKVKLRDLSLLKAPSIIPRSLQIMSLIGKVVQSTERKHVDKLNVKKYLDISLYKYHRSIYLTKNSCGHGT